MAHQSVLVLQAAVTRLTNATSAGARVEHSRVDPHKKSQLPAIAVFSLHEVIDREASEGTAPRELTRIAAVEIAGYVGGTDSAAIIVALGDLRQQIEAAMDADPYLGGAAADSILDETDIEIRAEDGRSDPLVGIATLTYMVTYRTYVGVSDPVDDFVTVDATHKVPGDAADTPKAPQEFTVQEPPP